MAKKKLYKDRKTHKQRGFVMDLYPDNPNHAFLILQLSSYQYNALGICHDKDVYLDDVVDDETGELKHKKGDFKKKHFHFIVEFENNRYISGVAKELGVEEHLIQFLDGFFDYAVYMLHWKYPEKHQYDIDEFIGTLAAKAKEKILKKPESLQFKEIFDFIDNYNGKINYSIVFKYAYEKGYYGALRRNTYGVKEFIYDHNERFYNKG